MEKKNKLPYDQLKRNLMNNYNDTSPLLPHKAMKPINPNQMSTEQLLKNVL